jgi:hypothetical protein
MTTTLRVGQLLPLSRVLGRRSRRRLHTIGACATCGVQFAAMEEQRGNVEEILRVHQRICPGGRRGGEVIAPYE